MRETTRLLGNEWSDAETWRGAAAALGGARWVFRHRRVVAPVLEMSLTRIDAASRQRRSLGDAQARRAL